MHANASEMLNAIAVAFINSKKKNGPIDNMFINRNIIDVTVPEYVTHIIVLKLQKYYSSNDHEKADSTNFGDV